MATADDVITIPRLRNAIGEIGDANDTLITAYRAAAIVWLERWIGRNITNKTGYASEPGDFDYCNNPEALIFQVPDITGDSVTLNYAPSTSDPTGRATSSLEITVGGDNVNLNRDRIIIYAGTTSWSSTMRFNHPVPYITASVGMLPADIPDPWREAIALIVRAIFDGSVYDDISNMSVLSMLLSPWKGGDFDGSIR